MRRMRSKVFEVIVFFKYMQNTFSITAMKQNFCTRTTRRIHRLGYTYKVAAFYAGFFCISMMLICAVMGALRVPSQVVHERTNGPGQSHAAARHPSFLSAEFALRR
jgi:hypothetical protein